MLTISHILSLLLTFSTLSTAAHPPPEEMNLELERRQNAAQGGGVVGGAAATAQAATTTYAASLITAGGTTTTEWVAFTQTFNTSLGTWVFPTASSGSIGLGTISGTVG